jgi:hypothetical protein
MSMPSQIAILNTADDSVRKVELPGNMFPPQWRCAPVLQNPNYSPAAHFRFVLSLDKRNHIGILKRALKLRNDYAIFPRFVHHESMSHSCK